MKTCPNCGMEYEDGELSCPLCGFSPEEESLNEATEQGNPEQSESEAVFAESAVQDVSIPPENRNTYQPKHTNAFTVAASKKTNKMLILCIALAAIMLALAAVVVFLLLGQNQNDAVEMLQMSSEVSSSEISEDTTEKVVTTEKTTATTEAEVTETTTTTVTTEAPKEAPTMAAPATEAPTEASTEDEKSAPYITITQDSIFVADTWILGMSYEEVESALGMTLPAQQDFSWWGTNLKNVDITYMATEICLMFQDNVLVMIIHDAKPISTLEISMREDSILEYYGSTAVQQGGGLYGNGYRWNFDGYYYECFPEHYADTDTDGLKQWYVWNGIYGLY